MSKFICQYCERPAPNAGAHAKHEKHCHQNPNYVKGYRSPKAGQQKGSIPWNQGIPQGRHPNWDEKYSLEKVLVENSTYGRSHLKKRLIRDKIIEYKCDCCGIGPEWNGKPMPLILDHINGINNDNRLENLRFVCSNCDTQLDTYKSRNRRNKRRVNCSGSSTVLKTVGTLTGMEFDSASPPPIFE